MVQSKARFAPRDDGCATTLRDDRACLP